MAGRRPDLVRRLVLVGGWVALRGPRDVLAFQTLRALADGDADTSARFTAMIIFSPGFLSAVGAEARVSACPTVTSSCCSRL